MHSADKNSFWGVFIPVATITVLCLLGIHGLTSITNTVSNDSGQFLSGAWISAMMVTPDAAIWQAGAIPILVLAFKMNLRQVILISTMIALAHQVYGLLGLAIRGVGETFEAYTLPVILGIVTYLVIGFVVNETAGGDDGDDENAVQETAEKLLRYGIISLAAFFTVYTGFSIDEMFAVLGRDEWMNAQGWSFLLKVLNVTVGMTYLWLILTIEAVVLYGIVKLTENTDPMQWLLRHGDRVMFLVFSLLVYFVSRGWYQNVLGNDPTELTVSNFNTGFAYWVYLTLGLAPMIALSLLLRFDGFKNVLLWFFGPQQRLIDAIEAWSERRSAPAD